MPSTAAKERPVSGVATNAFDASAHASAQPDTRSDGEGRFKLVNSTVLLLVACAVVSFASRFVAPGLGTWSQLDTVITISVFAVLAAYGEGLVVLTGGLDLSVASIITLGGVLGAQLLSMGVPDWAALVLVLFVCGLVGLCSGIGVAIARIPAFIMTLAVGLILSGVILGVTKGTPGNHAPEIFVWIMKARVPYLGMHVAVLALIVFALVGWWLQQYSKMGRYWYAVGNSDRAAHLAGVPVFTGRILPYVIAAVCYGLAGLCLTAYSNGAALDMGSSYLLPAIAAVVIGGASILGGTGHALSTIIAAVLLTLIGTTVQAINGGIAARTILNGAIILAALLLLTMRSHHGRNVN